MINKWQFFFNFSNSNIKLIIFKNANFLIWIKHRIYLQIAIQNAHPLKFVLLFQYLYCWSLPVYMCVYKKIQYNECILYQYDYNKQGEEKFMYIFG